MSYLLFRNITIFPEWPQLRIIKFLELSRWSSPYLQKHIQYFQKMCIWNRFNIKGILSRKAQLIQKDVIHKQIFGTFIHKKIYCMFFTSKKLTCLWHCRYKFPKVLYNIINLGIFYLERAVIVTSKGKYFLRHFLKTMKMTGYLHAFFTQ